LAVYLHIKLQSSLENIILQDTCTLAGKVGPDVCNQQKGLIYLIKFHM